ncbi:hypothetical protein TCA2_4215 [Paenibacillus sp. TCA20]|uniref:oxidoreductase n=1 Tax=Paenibacillus sp. TCA20 TaxID=1499968 RepID=UPI0004D4C78F|nr:oxidoreductase [Paenibacillus sp. TCA20]GAK41723.1 hypothetical protein TCA2_4215 [Paenibacillus sp. TCA20]
MINNELLQPVRIGPWQLQTRIVMAPMTRSFANDVTGTVGEDVIAYYQRRAEDGIGLIITEGIIPTIQGKGTFGVPGLYTSEQVSAWRKVTEAVHEKGGTIIAQLWHVGRLTHPDLTGGRPPLAPSALRAEGLVHRLHKPYAMPKEMTDEDIRMTVHHFKQAANNAIQAGFDGVEIHGAHGYLIDQFASESTNRRTDGYGGHRTQRLRLMREILSAIGEDIGMERVVLRFSELKDDQPSFRWLDPIAEIESYIEMFHEVGLQVIHPSTNHFSQPIWEGLTFHELVRSRWEGYIIGVGNLTPDSAVTAIRSGVIDLAAFGRPLLANNDFVNRLKKGLPLNPYNSAIHLAQLI